MHITFMLKTSTYISLFYILAAIFLVGGCQSSPSIAKQPPVVVKKHVTTARPPQPPVAVNNQTAAASPVQPVLQRQSAVLDGHRFDLLPPFNWALEISENLIVLADETGQKRGEITLIGYYGNDASCLPNHSTCLSEEDTETPLGAGKIFVLERDHPAAVNNPEKWQEIYAVIPIPNKDLAYLFWITSDTQENIEVNKDLLRFIMNHMEAVE